MYHALTIALALTPGQSTTAPSSEAPIVYRDASALMLPLATVQGRTMDAEWADLNGDGRPDLIIASEFGQNAVLIMPENGDLRRAANALPQGRTHDSEDIAIADFNGDGALDVVFVAEDDQTNELYLGDGDGAFKDASDRLPQPGGVSNAVLAVDLDGDGHVDLLLGNKGPNMALMNDGQGRFVPAPDRLPRDAATTQDLELGDLDGDGDLDLFVANEEENAILLNDGTGHFKASDGLGSVTGSYETREADLFDADADGDLDVILANVRWRPGVDSRNVLLHNDGQGRFEFAVDATPMKQAFTIDVDPVDIDGDGDLDLVLANLQTSAVEVWRNDGTGRFEPAPNGMVPNLPATHGIDVECVDLDGDGRLEIYLANHAGPDRLLTRE